MIVLKGYKFLGLLTFLLIAKINYAQHWSQPTKMNGVSIWSDTTKRSKEDFDFLEVSNANWVAFHPFGFVHDDTSGVIFDLDSTWECTSFDGLINNITISKNLGYSVFIKPHLILEYEKPGAWVGNLMLSEEASEFAFKRTYADYIISLAKIADSTGVDMLSLGTELSSFTMKNHDYWAALMDSVEYYYNGLVTYCANFDAYKDYPFWNRMDCIGIDAYFTLDKSENAELDACREGWRPIASEIKEYSIALKKQVVFTEFGYMSASKCAYRPFEQHSGDVNLVAQANAYRALFDVFGMNGGLVVGFLGFGDMTMIFLKITIMSSILLKISLLRI